MHPEHKFVSLNDHPRLLEARMLLVCSGNCDLKDGGLCFAEYTHGPIRIMVRLNGIDFVYTLWKSIEWWDMMEHTNCSTCE